MSLTVYYPSLDDPARQARLDRVLSQALAGREVQIIRRAEDLDRRRFPRILFALPLDEAGQNFAYFTCWPACAGRQTCWRAAPAA